MGVSVEAEKLLSKLAELRNLDYSPAIKDGCLIVEREAKQAAPVRSGELRSSIESRVSGNEGEVGTSLFYAPYVEYGTGLFSSKGTGRTDVPWHYQDSQGNWHTTSGMRPNPFLIPAFEKNRNRIVEAIALYIKEHLE